VPAILSRHLTLRLRLTFWYSAVLAGIIILFGLAVYGIMRFSLLRQIDIYLTETAKGVIAASQYRVDISTVELPKLDRFGTARVYVQVWDEAGRLAASSENLAYDDSLDPRALGRARATHREVMVENVHLWVVTEPIRTPDGRIIGYVQAASQLDQVNFAKNALLVVLVGGGVAAVVLATIVGWLAAHRALQPLETITQTALQITRADDLSRRIPMTGEPRDEVGRLALAFNESLERLERLFNAQRRFLADVSHELRTPLTVIRGNVDLLRRMGGADPTSLDAIQSEAERMSRLVGDLLLLAQAEAGTLPLVHGPVELDTLLLEVYHESQVLAGNVHLGIGEIDQVIVMGDGDRLKQLLLNLVSNALKYTPEGGRVTLGLARVNGWARLVVSDTGLGIPPDELPYIFERFYRVDKARSRAQGGSGLGLAIAQRIAMVHGGRIEATSDATAGRGSTFSLLLPLAPNKTNLEDTAPLDVTRPAAFLPPMKKAGS
jgi:two-component system, OmpR family, sensor kinase